MIRLEIPHHREIPQRTSDQTSKRIDARTFPEVGGGPEVATGDDGIGIVGGGGGAG